MADVSKQQKSKLKLLYSGEYRKCAMLCFSISQIHTIPWENSLNVSSVPILSMSCLSSVIRRDSKGKLKTVPLFKGC